MFEQWLINKCVDKYDEKTKQFGQTLSIDGKIVSTQSLAIGKGNQFNTAVEVQGGWAGTILAHSKFPFYSGCA